MSSETILVVENHRHYSDLLEAEGGYAVVTARDDDGAAALLRDQPPALLLLDITTPQVESLKFCRRAREMLGAERPIILLAEADDPDTLYEALQDGANDYLLKSDRAEAVLERIAYWLRKAERTVPAEEEQQDEAGPTAPADGAAEADDRPRERPAVRRSAARRSAARRSAIRRSAAASGAKSSGTAHPRPRRPRPRQPRTVRLVKWAATALGALWLMGAGYHEVLRPDPVEHYRAMMVKRQVQNCKGTFKQRYECKTALVVSHENRMFYSWTRKIGVIVIPPLILAVLYHSFFLKMYAARTARRGRRPAVRRVAHKPSS